ncbi:right-handed parallel beta-helix repeat-containing protein [Glycomyces xiaoerkulensis]|uniref:right-handed parallel beta-helix repeat-containing protein n=1 Tax=Glycomyces xiaoerkulensis TaxID=2038139 RepID=UPI000C25D424|nr:right-handed parallel beta-helix repeat-containing protein [Glycomyces xiaoerkulensis]
MPPFYRKSLPPAALCALVAGTAAAIGAPAHAQETESPEYRDEGPYLLVCIDDEEDFTARNEEVGYNRRLRNERLFAECQDDGYESLADALAAEPGPESRILVLPGRYTVEETITVDGAEDLQIEGLGDGPADVQFAAGYAAESVITSDDSTGLYLKGFTVLQARGNGLELTGAEGATVEGVAGTRNGGHGLRIDDSAGVRMADCGATQNDGAGIAIEDVAAEIEGCESNGNHIGLLDTGRSRAFLTSNRLHDNTTGLVVTESAGDHHLEARSNAIFDNNADHYGRLDGAACTGPLEERDWSTGLLCPSRTFPSGVGVLVAQSSGTLFAGNHLWGQHTAAAMVWGDPDIGEAGADRNRFEGNTFGFRDDGRRDRNRSDLWWDGQGEGNCFSEPGVLHTSPAVMPGCDSGPGPDRLAADPVKTYKVGQCGIGPLDGGAPPAGCDWFGAQFTDRLEFQSAVVFAAALLFLTGTGWFGAARSANPPPPMSMTFSAIATGFAALLMVLAAWSGRADYEALAIGLWGLGWLLAGRSWFAAGLTAFGGFTCLIGGLAVLDAIDRGMWIIPVMPFSPAWLWLLPLPLWVLLALTAVFRRRPKEPEAPAVERTPATIPVYNRFDW